MRVGFAGTPEFASTALERIVAAGFTVPLVLTQPDRPAGRGLAFKNPPREHPPQPPPRRKRKMCDCTPQILRQHRTIPA